MQLVDVVTWARLRLSEKDMRPAGISLVAAAALAGLVGVGAVLFAQDAQGMQKYVYREIAGGALGLALALFLGGAVASLPMKPAARSAGAAGFVFCMIGVSVFVWLYPRFWNVPGRDLSPLGIVSYAIGLAYLVGSMTSGLVTAIVESRTRREEADGLDADVTDEEVMRDLLDTTRRSRLSWGGIHVRDDGMQLDASQWDFPELEGKLDRLGVASSRESLDFDDDVDALLALRGVKKGTSEDYDDDTVSALARLRQSQADALANTWWARFLAWWHGLWTRA